MPAKPQKQLAVNLLGQNSLEYTPIGRMVGWINTYGRYIMVTTELIVLVAFVSRFSLDRKLTDLKEEISQKQEIIQVNQPLEKTIKDTQMKLTSIKKLIDQQAVAPNAISALHSALPVGTYVDTITANQNQLQTNIKAISTGSFSQVLSNLNATKQLGSITIDNVTKQPPSIISFGLTAQYGQKPQPQQQKK